MAGSPVAPPSASSDAPLHSSLAPPVRGLAVALTMHNSIRTIDATLASLHGLAERVLIVDSGSTDGSIERARHHGAEVLHKQWAGHVIQKQFAVDQCAGAAWVLLLDSDESLDAALAAEVRTVLGTGPRTEAGFRLNRRLVLHGRALRFAYQPEWRVRLFRPERGRIAGTPPHDRVDVDGPIGSLTGDLLHDSWADVEDMLRRQLGYARIQGQDPGGGAPRGGSLFDIAVRPPAAFLKQYLMKQGFRDGWRGLVAASGAAAATLMKHVVLAERRGLERDRCGPDRERRGAGPLR